MIEYRYREMLPSDLAHVGPLYREMLVETKKENDYPIIKDINAEVEEFSFGTMKILRAILDGNLPPIWCGIVALDGKAAKGFVCGGIQSRVVGNPKRYYLGECLYVQAKFRHRGIGERLVRSAANWAVANGAGALEVRFVPGTEAHKNWARMGFRSYAGLGVFAGKDGQPILDYPEFRKPAGKNGKEHESNDRSRISSSVQEIRKSISSVELPPKRPAGGVVENISLEEN